MQPDAKAIQDAIDKIEIGELQSRYMFAMDWYDADLYAEVFVEDGELIWPGGHCRGKDAIRESRRQVIEFNNRLAAVMDPRTGKPQKLRHFITNRVIRIDGDNARAVAYWVDYHNDNQYRRPYVAAYGHYEDDLVRTAEGWRFTRRRIFNEMEENSPEENPAW